MIRALAGKTDMVPAYLRYGVVSALALGVDMAIFLLLISTTLAPATASGISYLAGMVAHWLLSSRLVFGSTLANPGAARGRQQLLFFGSALVGMMLTMAIVGIGDAFGLDPRFAKLIAVAVSFNATYVLRRVYVFG